MGEPLGQVEVPRTKKKPLTKRQRKKEAHRARRRHLWIVPDAPLVEVSLEPRELSSDNKPKSAPDQRTRNLKADQTRRRKKRKANKATAGRLAEAPQEAKKRKRSKKKEHKKPKHRETLAQLKQEIEDEDRHMRAEDVRFRKNPRSCLPLKATEACFRRIEHLAACRANCGWKGSLSDLSAHYKETGHGPPRNNLLKKKEYEKS